jgi:hypothetical protein
MVFHIPREGERLKNICFLTGGQEGCGVSSMQLDFSLEAMDEGSKV